MGNVVRPALSLLAALMILTGVAYPLAVTALAQAFFPYQANGSLVMRDGRPAASALIGQGFTGPEYFWPRPSATAPAPYNAAASGASNLGPSNPALTDAVAARVAALRAADPGNHSPVPVDLVTASASGLDPDISLAAALYQAPRVARARGLAVQQVMDLVNTVAEQPWGGFLGEARVKVVRLNLAMDASLGAAKP